RYENTGSKNNHLVDGREYTKDDITLIIVYVE
ncbi:unnamed protein product, partial [marine sediment metagenome]